MLKVILVSPEGYHDYFKEHFPSWDLQHVIENLDDMWQGIQDGTLSQSSEIIILNDGFFEEEESKRKDFFAASIASLASSAMVVVVSYDKDTETVLTKRVNELFDSNPDTYEKAPFYFAHSDADPIEDINVAIKDWNERNNAPKNHKADEAVNNKKDIKPVRPETLDDIIEEHGHILTNKELPPLKERGIIIASTSSKGGSGKTTVALCTASMLYHSSRIAAQEGYRDRPLNVCVVDLDVRDGQIGFLVNAKEPTILNLFIQDKKPDRETIQSKLVKKEGLGIYTLLAPRFGRTASIIKNEFYQHVIYVLSTMFDVVILDTSVNYLDKLLSEVVLPISDKIFFITNLSKGSIFGMTRWMQEMVFNKDIDTHVTKDKINVVINQAIPDVGVDLEMVTQQAIGIPLTAAIPSDSETVLRETNNYTLENVILKHPEISEQYFRIAKKIVAEMPQDDAIIISPTSHKLFARDEIKNRIANTVVDETVVAEAEKVEPASKEEDNYTVAPPKKIGGLFK